MTEKLQQLAECYGIDDGYMSETGAWVKTPLSTKAEVLKVMGVAVGSEAEIEESLARAPEPVAEDDIHDLSKSAFWPLWLVENRVWGLATQLYSLRSARNWGIGDFQDLADLAAIMASLGADFIGISPLHALFTADSSRISPYAPSTRNFLNPIFIAPDKVAGFDSLPNRDEFLAELPELRASQLIDYEGVYRVKMKALEALYERFIQSADEASRKAFAHFQLEQGAALQNFALYETLSEYFVEQGGYVAWSTWPPEFQDRDSLAVRDFARGHKDRIAFHIWLQWIADTQLAAAQNRARRSGMRIGLYLDLAIGASPDGSSAWCGGHATARKARIGAPPDALCPGGQNWGLIPFSPMGLDQQHFDPFRELLRANMRHAGALRLDHAMGLKRLYWIPENSDALGGAYVRYPFRDMLEMVADESWVARCLVIGEDLGTVPPGFSDTIVRGGMLSYQVLYFSRQEGRFLPPHAYRREAMVCASTHDLPTLRGWWQGNDVAWRFRVGASTHIEATSQAEGRRSEKRLLVEALCESGLLGGDPAVLSGRSEMSEDILIAIHRFLAWTPCRLFAVQLDDVLGTEEQANLPGTTDEHPNWRRKMTVNIGELTQHHLFRKLADAIAAERPR
ncbi:4-alpha-glucanotransferase [Methyloligella sp. 2.7D]|uniref:4-alpha-glucanotransferase n=1 Tax=unclassified Methyloligella TaxID=2625955 RepID=UPI00157BF474|nr:4-alpha-glucanotransferase [Methyloligella sp. GL2]QKP76991.1 4-alpha-glucanotransferase [Methyloligella sp. GL2]